VVGAPRAATDKTLTITTTRKTPLTKTLPKPQCSIRHRPKRQALRYGSQTNADHTPTFQANRHDKRAAIGVSSERSERG
jgi:hypothetical protein